MRSILCRITSALSSDSRPLQAVWDGSGEPCYCQLGSVQERQPLPLLEIMDSYKQDIEKQLTQGVRLPTVCDGMFIMCCLLINVYDRND